MNPFDQFDAKQGNPFDQFDAAPEVSAVEDPSVVADVAAGGLSGVGRGIASIPGFAGDVQELARKAPWAPKRSLLDAILEKTIGTKNLPTSNDTIAAANKVVPGLDYVPQTSEGAFAQKAGEFVPNMFGGEGRLLTKAVKNVIAPAAGSSMAESAAEGTGLEPVASALGSIVGGSVAHNVPRAFNRAATPGGFTQGLIKQDPRIERDVNTLQSAGVKLSAGDVTGSNRLRWAEDAADKMPFARDIYQESQSSLNNSFFKQAGSRKFLDKETGQFNPETWLKGDERFKKLYDSMNGQSFVDYNPTFNARLHKIEQDYNDWTNATGKVKGVSDWFDKVRDIAVSGNGKLAGPDAQSWRSELVNLKKSLNSTSSEHKAIDGLVKLIDGSLEANTPARYKNIRNQVNRQYSNYKLLETAAGRAGSNSGYISPAIVRGEAAKRNNRALQRGTSDLGELARAAENVMKRKPSSGTAERAMSSGALGGAVGLTNLLMGATGGRALTSDTVQRILGGGVKPARQARTALPVDKDAILRAGILGLLSGN